jgi:hypothetical protein
MGQRVPGTVVRTIYRFYGSHRKETPEVGEMTISKNHPLTQRSMPLRRLLVASSASMLAQAVWADNFASISYDPATQELVVTMIYRGTHPDHSFSLKWGECHDSQSGSLPEVTAEVLDAQWEDPARDDFRKTIRFSLADLPCRRPASVTLRTAPRFFYTLKIPK